MFNQEMRNVSYERSSLFRQFLFSFNACDDNEAND